MTRKRVDPKVGDQLVLVEKTDHVTKPEDLPVEGPRQMAYPMDSRDKIARDESYFNQEALVRLDPTQLSEESRSLCGGRGRGVLGRLHPPGCPMSMWKADTKNLFRSCRGSQFDPWDRAKVADGPAHLAAPMLPRKLVDRVLVVAAEFTGRVGPTSPQDDRNRC